MPKKIRCNECESLEMHLEKDFQESDDEKDVYHLVCAKCGFVVWGCIEDEKEDKDQF